MDIALSVEKILGVAEYGSAQTYQKLQSSWRDSRPIPTEAQLSVAWAQVQAELLQEGFTRVVQSHLDDTAKLKGYDGILSATTYAGYVNIFQAEGTAYGEWRSAVWKKCYDIMAQVQAGTRTVPTEAELLAELPVLVLP